MTDALRLKVKPFGIKVVIIEPGSIATGLEDTAMRTLSDGLFDRTDESQTG